MRKEQFERAPEEWKRDLMAYVKGCEKLGES